MVKKCDRLFAKCLRNRKLSHRLRDAFVMGARVAGPLGVDRTQQKRGTGIKPARRTAIAAPRHQLQALSGT